MWKKFARFDEVCFFANRSPHVLILNVKYIFKYNYYLFGLFICR